MFTLVTTGAVLYILGVRNPLALILGAAVAFFPVGIVVAMIVRRVVPPSLTFSGDYRETLYGRDEDER